MRTVVAIFILVVLALAATGFIVLHRQGTHPCVTYFNKTGSHELTQNCEQQSE